MANTEHTWQTPSLFSHRRGERWSLRSRSGHTPSRGGICRLTGGTGRLRGAPTADGAKLVAFEGGSRQLAQLPNVDSRHTGGSELGEGTPTFNPGGPRDPGPACSGLRLRRCWDHLKNQGDHGVDNWIWTGWAWCPGLPGEAACWWGTTCSRRTSPLQPVFGTRWAYRGWQMDSTTRPGIHGP